MCCLPYRKIKYCSDKLSKEEVNFLCELLKSNIQSSVYLKNVSDEFISDEYIEICNDIMRKLKIMDFGC